MSLCYCYKVKKTYRRVDVSRGSRKCADIQWEIKGDRFLGFKTLFHLLSKQV